MLMICSEGGLSRPTCKVVSVPSVIIAARSGGALVYYKKQIKNECTSINGKILDTIDILLENIVNLISVYRLRSNVRNWDVPCAAAREQLLA